MTAISEIGIQSVGHKLCQSVVSRGGLREFSESDGGSRECKRGFLYSYLRSRLRERVPSTTQHLSTAVLACHLSLHSTDRHPPWGTVDARAWGKTRTTLESKAATVLTGRKQGTERCGKSTNFSIKTQMPGGTLTVEIIARRFSRQRRHRVLSDGTSSILSRPPLSPSGTGVVFFSNGDEAKWEHGRRELLILSGRRMMSLKSWMARKKEPET